MLSVTTKSVEEVVKNRSTWDSFRTLISRVITSPGLASVISRRGGIADKPKAL